MHHNRRLLQLLRDNPREAAAPALKIRAEGDEATIYLYDVIDPWFGVSAGEFVRALNGIKAGTIHLRINSPGGDVFDARAIATAIAQHPSTVIAHVDGVAASAATIVAVAADEAEMADGAFFMIHQAWALAMGNSEDMLAMAALLEKADQTIVADYARKTGMAKDALVQAMAEETWYTAAEAKAAGFVDRIAGGEADANAQASAWNLAAYEKAPKALTERPKPANAAEADLAAQRAALERRLAMYDRSTRIAA